VRALWHPFHFNQCRVLLGDAQAVPCSFLVRATHSDINIGVTSNGTIELDCPESSDLGSAVMSVFPTPSMGRRHENLTIVVKNNAAFVLI
jgi:hypothetical protein